MLRGEIYCPGLFHLWLQGRLLLSAPSEMCTSPVHISPVWSRAPSWLLPCQWWQGLLWLMGSKGRALPHPPGHWGWAWPSACATLPSLSRRVVQDHRHHIIYMRANMQSGGSGPRPLGVDLRGQQKPRLNTRATYAP